MIFSVRTQPMQGELINYIVDESVLYILMNNKSMISLFVLDPNSFEKIYIFNILNNIVEHLNPCIDNDCIYVPTSDGQIIGYDKFNGRSLIHMDLGPMLAVSDPYSLSITLKILC